MVLESRNKKFWKYTDRSKVFFNFTLFIDLSGKFLSVKDIKYRLLLNKKQNTLQPHFLLQFQKVKNQRG